MVDLLALVEQGIAAPPISPSNGNSGMGAGTWILIVVGIIVLGLAGFFFSRRRKG